MARTSDQAWEVGETRGQPSWVGSLWPRSAPILAAVLLQALDRQVSMGRTGWADLILNVAGAGLICMPFLAAHLASYRLPASTAVAVWLAGFVLYPAAVLGLSGEMLPSGSVLTARDWAIAALFSGSFRLAEGETLRRVFRSRTVVGLRTPVALDLVIAALLLVWTLAAAGLFASTPDPVRNQPLSWRLDGERILALPLEFLGYAWQFAVIALLAFGLYWSCRYLLIRRVQHTAGWLAFGFASIALFVFYTPLACSILLQLPLNEPGWTLIPSEDHNPFARLNYEVTLAAMLVVLPIVLAFERLLSERTDAIGAGEQARAELRSLQQQINPHFLFNTLNSLYSLCLQDRAESAQALIKLSDLLRYSVYEGQKMRVGLDREVEYLQNYLDLQMLRVGHRCRLHGRWPDDSARHSLPPLLLIALLENAFKHGVEPSDGDCTVSVDLQIDGDTLTFACENSLPLDVVAAPAGIGLANLRRRLELICGTKFHLRSAREGDVWRSELRIRPC